MADNYADSLNVAGEDILLAPVSGRLIIDTSAVGTTSREIDIPNYYLDIDNKLYFRVLFQNGWNAAFTLNVNGLGAKSIKVYKGGSLVSLNATGDAGTVLELFFNGLYFVVVGNPMVHVASGYNEYADGTNGYTATQVNGALAEYSKNHIKGDIYSNDSLILLLGQRASAGVYYDLVGDVIKARNAGHTWGNCHVEINVGYSNAWSEVFNISYTAYAEGNGFRKVLCNYNGVQYFALDLQNVSQTNVAYDFLNSGWKNGLNVKIVKTSDVSDIVEWNSNGTHFIKSDLYSTSKDKNVTSTFSIDRLYLAGFKYNTNEVYITLPFNTNLKSSTSYNISGTIRQYKTNGTFIDVDFSKDSGDGCQIQKYYFPRIYVYNGKCSNFEFGNNNYELRDITFYPN